MAINEIIRTSGDIRRVLAQTMIEVRSGELSVEKGLCVAALSKEITANIQAEVNVAKVRVAMLDGGKNLGDVTQLGRLVIEDEGSTPTLDGK